MIYFLHNKVHDTKLAFCNSNTFLCYCYLTVLKVNQLKVTLLKEVNFKEINTYIKIKDFITINKDCKSKDFIT